MTGDRRLLWTVAWLSAPLLLLAAAGARAQPAVSDDPIGDLVAAQAAAEAKPKAPPAPVAAPSPSPPKLPAAAPPPVYLQPASPGAADATTDEETPPGSSRSGLPPAAFFRPPPWSLDGRWVVTGRDGRSLYILQLSETGGQVDGAWRDAARTASAHGFGVLSSVIRTGSSVVIRFSDSPNAPPSELTLSLGPDGAWTGQGRLGDQTVAVIMKRL